MENVVYILGAGFSAPLDIPIVRDFLQKAQDLLAREPQRYAYFEHVFERIDRFSKAKTFYSVDVENVEEVLSMLEMMEYAGPSEARLEVARFIIDVIRAYTPEVQRSPDEGKSELSEWVFGNGYLARGYGMFVAGLCGLRPRGTAGYNPEVRVDDNPPARYSVVSLNYDTVLESAFDFMAESWGVSRERGFAVYPGGGNASGRCLLAKLHGTVSDDPEAIVPPTWNKTRKPAILSAWQKAFEALSRANRIRIIGYSLPENDAYFRYLLKAAATRSRNLKSVHVLCRDENDVVRTRYEQFVAPGKLRFTNGSTTDLLGRLPESTKLEKNTDPMRVDTLTVNLEDAHMRAFGTY